MKSIIKEGSLFGKDEPLSYSGLLVYKFVWLK